MQNSFTNNFIVSQALKINNPITSQKMSCCHAINTIRTLQYLHEVKLSGNTLEPLTSGMSMKYLYRNPGQEDKE